MEDRARNMVAFVESAALDQALAYAERHAGEIDEAIEWNARVEEIVSARG